MAYDTEYPTTVQDDEWAFIAPYLTLRDPESGTRTHPLRDVFNALRYIVRTGCSWRLLPRDFPPWPVVYQQTQRWIAAGVFEAIVHDLRAVLRMGEARAPDPTAVIFDSRTVKSTTSSTGAAYDGAKRVKERKMHAVVETLGHLLALHVTPANDQDRAQVATLCERLQAVTGGTVLTAFVDQGYTGAQPAADAQAHGITLSVVKHPAGTKGFILLPRRWVVERSFGWLNKFRRMARDYERLPRTVEGLTFLCFAITFLSRALRLFATRALTPSRASSIGLFAVRK
jgi:transposase